MILEPHKRKLSPSTFALEDSSKQHKRGIKIRAVCFHYPPKPSTSTCKTNLSLVLCGPKRTQLPPRFKKIFFFLLLQYLKGQHMKRLFLSPYN